MKLNTLYYKLITYLLLFTIIFPFIAGGILIIPAYASDGASTNNFLDAIKGLLSLFFLSFVTGQSDGEANPPDQNDVSNPYQSAAQEAPVSIDQPDQKKRLNLTDQEFKTLVKAIHGEARGEPFKGQVAVAAVIINRVKSPEFPNDINSVVYQKIGGSYAFSAVLDGQIIVELYKVDDNIYEAANYALNGWDPTNGSLYYYNPITATSSWIFENTTKVQEIGNHVFAELK
ncbi:cell wall hydrolase [Halanaerobaculum tunisiense]